MRLTRTWLVTTLTDTPHQLLVTTLYFTNWPPDRCLFSCLQAPVGKMREMLIYQLVQGYKLRELEVKKELKDKFWGK